MVTIVLPAFLAVFGAVVYLFSSNPKFAELGKVIFAAGMFALAFAVSGRTLTL